MTAPTTCKRRSFGSTIGSILLDTRPPLSRPSLSFLCTKVHFAFYKTSVLHAAARGRGPHRPLRRCLNLRQHIYLNVVKPGSLCYWALASPCSPSKIKVLSEEVSGSLQCR
ncbi:hypothetical protein GALMADRAFT_1140093 [Galerina marginata CBS 339.88]|uniref:Uncharacterized protein n=1 Tax=Galerina marginata (strain CBS 339.88) TaxID=685588 RepID=A0A067S7G2_GALM3|nr:hypothetical protein GALMADRAFT_1140093 [Galerina marginata CBS 339.88]